MATQTTATPPRLAPRWAALVALVLATSCGPPLLDEMTIEPSSDDDSVVVTVSTTFGSTPASDRARRRVESARNAAASNNDAWAIRFSRLTPVEEHVTYAKRRGSISSVTRGARIAGDDLQQLFSDTGITVDVLRGDGWRELALYPGTSGRATREQRQRFDVALAQWSGVVTRYFAAMHGLYTYLDEQPDRARYVFATLLEEEGADGTKPQLTDEELPLVQAVMTAMEELSERMPDAEGAALTFAEEADLIFNPFPARIVVIPPSEVLAVEGFTKDKDALAIEPVNLFAAIGELEGQWITPDPLASLLREEMPTAESLAALPRHSTSVIASGDVARALALKLAKPKTFRVRWRQE